MRIAFGTDEQTDVTDHIETCLVDAGHTIVVPIEHGSSWTDVGAAVGDAVTSGRAAMGIVCCWTGTGVSIAANKVPGVRAALCIDAETAAGARRWNDANVLALSLRLATPDVVDAIVDAFLTTEVDPAEADEIAKLGSTDV